MRQVFTDAEHAVTMDALIATRDDLQKKGVATPNVESALEKFKLMAGPTSSGFTLVSGDDAPG